MSSTTSPKELGDRGPEADGPLRLFLAVPAPPQARLRSERVLRELRGQGDVRWVTPERLHLTLKFLGATPASKIPRLCEVVAETANAFSSFVVELAGVGAFPNARRPRTVWLGIQPAERLSRLAAEIDQAVEGLGFQREQRAFRAHLTLGRVKSSRGIEELAGALRRIDPDDEPREPWSINAIELIRSDLRPTGPEYSTLRRFPLRREE